MSRLRWAFLAAACLWAIGPTAARAANVNFIETGDALTIQPDTNWECGVTFTTEGENGHLDGCWITNSPPGYAGASEALMVEPAGQPDAGAISDRIRIQFNVTADGLAHIAIDFLSDPNTAPPEFPPPGIPVIVENGQQQLVNGFFFGAAGPQEPPANLTIYAQSDITEPTVGVEPVSWGNLKALYR